MALTIESRTNAGGSMDIQTTGKILVIIGAVVLVIGGLLWLAGGSPWLQNLLASGTIRLQSGGMTCLIPIVASILISVIGTIVLNIIIRLINK